MIRKKVFLWGILSFLILTSNLNAQEKSAITWQPWQENLFQKAQDEKRFVILDLEAVWCHWCHVMEETTYQDPKVVELINARYLPVKVDQDANPDLSNRYEDYGWPATIIFGPDGHEIVKRRGYIPPAVMASLLQAIIDDPTPGPSVFAESEIAPAENAFLSQDQAQKLKEEHLALYDKENGGWGNVHKLIDYDQWQYAFTRAQKSDAAEETMARQTADQALNLLDPVWGGFFQYSDAVNWKSPHYEKIASIQSQYLRVYSLAYSNWKNPEYLKAAEATAAYLKNFLTSPEGAFYTSQDADPEPGVSGATFYALADAERRATKQPRIDTHIYSRENGWLISGLSFLYNATGNDAYLQQATRAAEFILKERAIEGGGFRHDAEDKAGPFLGDTLYMAEAFLNLYASSANRAWLKHAEDAIRFANENFREDDAGFDTTRSRRAEMGTFLKPVRQIDENIVLARTANLLSRYTGNKEYRAIAEHAMRYLASPAIAGKRRFLAGILIVDQELASEPAHITIVGAKDDATSQALYKAGLKYPSTYKRIEWWDPREGKLPNPDVQYPELKKPAAFACANGTCSIPIFTPEKIPTQVDRLYRKK